MEVTGMEENGPLQAGRTGEVLGKRFREEMAAYRLTEDQIYHALYYVLYMAGTADVHEALCDAAQDGFPYNADGEECRFARRLAVMMVMLDLDMKNNLDMQREMLKTVKEREGDVHGFRDG